MVLRHRVLPYDPLADEAGLDDLALIMPSGLATS
jgi:hypothetical protein